MTGSASINDTAGYITLYNKYALPTEQVTTLKETGGEGKAPKAHFAILLGISEDIFLLGEVKQFALSLNGAITNISLQGLGWAICDGTTPSSQGIIDPIIVTTPDLTDKFIKMSNDETSGSIGGTVNHNHTGTTSEPSEEELVRGVNPSSQEDVASDTHTHDFTTTTVDNLPPFYELVFFIKVK